MGKTSALSLINNAQLNDIANKVVTTSKLNKFPNVKPLAIFTSIADITTTGTGSIDLDTTNFKTGSASCRITATTTFSCTKPLATTDLSGKSIRIDFYVLDRTTFTGVDILLGVGADWVKYFNYSGQQIEYVNGWNSMVIPLSTFSLQGGALAGDLANVNKVRFKIYPVGGSTAIVSFDRIGYLVDSATKAKIILTFDDGEITTFTEAKKRMDEYGMRGVSYVVPNFVGQAGSMTLAQLKSLYECGWDLGSHTYSHLYMVSGGASSSQIEQELSSSKRWLLNNGFARGSNHFASPGGQYNDSILELIKKYYFTHRTIDLAYEFNPPTDPFKIKIQNIVNTTTILQVQGYIDFAIARKELLVLCFHYISNPADVGTKILPATFQSIIDYINTANIDVVTWSDLE